MTKAVPEERREELNAAYVAGATIREIAADVGAHPATVAKALRAWGVPMRAARKRSGSPSGESHRVHEGEPQKWCSACSEWIACAGFYVERRASDGLGSCCKTCKGKRAQKRRTSKNAAHGGPVQNDGRGQ